MSEPEKKVDPADWTVQLADGGETYPFTEDENCNITGLGHQDPEAFAAAVNRYDAEAGGFALEDQWTAEDITQLWALLSENEYGDWTLRQVPEGTEDAVAITTLWGQR